MLENCGMEQEKANQVYFIKEKKASTSNIRIMACGEKVFTLQKMPGIVMIIFMNMEKKMETKSRECFLHWWIWEESLICQMIRILRSPLMAMIASVDSQITQKFSLFTQTKKHIHSITLNILHHDLFCCFLNQIFYVSINFFKIKFFI